MDVAPYAGAWIERAHVEYKLLPKVVAPYAGAWIERYLFLISAITSASLPTRERGLKDGYSEASKSHGIVAPYAGAWIESISKN